MTIRNKANQKTRKKNRNLGAIVLVVALFWYAISMALLWKH
jgi:hypothetical protein